MGNVKVANSYFCRIYLPCINNKDDDEMEKTSTRGKINTNNNSNNNN